jgi:hypothetical protein
LSIWHGLWVSSLFEWLLCAWASHTSVDGESLSAGDILKHWMILQTSTSIWIPYTRWMSVHRSPGDLHTLLDHDSSETEFRKNLDLHPNQWFTWDQYLLTLKAHGGRPISHYSSHTWIAIWTRVFKYYGSIFWFWPPGPKTTPEPESDGAVLSRVEFATSWQWFCSTVLVADQIEVYWMLGKDDLMILDFHVVHLKQLDRSKPTEGNWGCRAQGARGDQTLEIYWHLPSQDWAVT